MKGRVVGINTAIVAGGTGIGFAIPVNMAKERGSPTQEQGQGHSRLARCHDPAGHRGPCEVLWIGQPKGALVSEVVKDGPADKAGIERGDVIVEFAGSDIDKMSELPILVAEKAPGSKVEVVGTEEGQGGDALGHAGELPEEGVAGAPPDGAGPGSHGTGDHPRTAEAPGSGVQTRGWSSPEWKRVAQPRRRVCGEET